MQRLGGLFGIIILATLAWPGAVLAQECSNGMCGTPDQSGGGCGCGCGSILINMTDRGLSYQFADDFDGDGIEDEFDNCPFVANVEQLDGDGDEVGDACDNCGGAQNADQADLDGDTIGDVCDDDVDGDSVANATDNCPTVANTSQRDSNDDDVGDRCDPNATPVTGFDDDEDGVDDSVDNCPDVYNPIEGGQQPDIDGNGVGDACDPDRDGDGVPNYDDNCPDKANPIPEGEKHQIDIDRDGLGDNGDFTGGAGSCDTEECYVVPGTGKENCLSVNGSFAIGAFPMAMASSGTFNTGETVTLVLLTNRRDSRHEWTARFEKVPSDSDAVLVNGKSGANGALPNSDQIAECSADGKCNNIHFKVDEPGDYVVKITAELPTGDPRGIGPASSTTLMPIKVVGEGDSGCAATGGSGSGLGALVAIALALGLRARRKSE